ncbi:MAG: hypothetical protein KAI91_06950, partial [Candidatus Omnitrophica bacterium]|nr:hypothetical protein [Candidatus Omnitrophota bacterium]
MVSAPIYFCSKGVETGAGVVVSRLLQPIVLSSQFPVSSSRPIITIPDGGSENKVVDMSKVGKGTVLYFIALIIAKFLVWIASCIVGLISPATNKNGDNELDSLTKLDTGKKENNPYSTEAPFNLPVVPVTLPNLPMEKGYKSMFKQFNGVLPSLFIFINNKLNISETLKSNRGVKTLFKNSLPVIRGPPLVVILIVLSLALVALVSNPDNLVVLSSVNIPPFYPLTEAVTVMFAVACSYIIYRVASGLIVASHDVQVLATSILINSNLKVRGWIQSLPSQDGTVSFQNKNPADQVKDLTVAGGSNPRRTLAFLNRFARGLIVASHDVQALAISIVFPIIRGALAFLSPRRANAILSKSGLTKFIINVIKIGGLTWITKLLKTSRKVVLKKALQSITSLYQKQKKSFISHVMITEEKLSFI